jgi:hypothetical protein
MAEMMAAAAGITRTMSRYSGYTKLVDDQGQSPKITNLENSFSSSTHKPADDIGTVTENWHSNETVHNLYQLHVSKKLGTEAIRRLYQDHGKCRSLVDVKTEECAVENEDPEDGWKNKGQADVLVE